MAAVAKEVLKRTKLFDWHVAKKAKMVPFAGWEMPVQYPLGVFEEHTHTRTKAGLFDVSHMGQLRFYGADREKFLEWITVADLKALPLSKGRLACIPNEMGGIKDDCILNKFADHVYMVINAGGLEPNIKYIQDMMRVFHGDVAMQVESGLSLIALQGPQAASVVGQYVEGLSTLGFMSGRKASIKGINVHITRCGYTGEDGFEISVAHADAVALAEVLTADARVQPIGLGARDSLRLEAGLCLYGHELSECTNPVDSALTWLITKRRWQEGGFVGYGNIKRFRDNAQTDLVPMRRVGILSQGACAREQTPILVGGRKVGFVTSGCPSPSLPGKNVAQAYVERDLAKAGTEVVLSVRGREVKGVVSKMPFVPTNYYKGDA